MSDLEDKLYQSLYLLSRTAEGFPLPERQLHPLWCCEHGKPEHKVDRGIVTMMGVRHDIAYCLACGLDTCEHEYSHERNWASDFAWPEHRLIVEVEGGVWARGRHVQPLGFIKDAEKYNELTLRGWAVIRVTQREVKSGEALNLIERALKGDRTEAWQPITAT